MSPPAAANQRPAGTRPRAGAAGRAPLSVLDRKALLERARRKRARILLGLSGLLVAGALGLVAAGQGLVVSQQLHLDRLDHRLANAVSRTQNLQVDRARLAAPSRILRIADHNLHMVAPGHVTYLEPITPATHTPATHAPATHAPATNRARRP